MFRPESGAIAPLSFCAKFARHTGVQALHLN
jgi:hypothetical protein